MKIKKRQFAFTGATVGSSATESMTFKCEIKVCKTSDEAICSTTNKAGTANTCPARTYFNSGRKRRSTADQSQIVELSKDGFKKHLTKKWIRKKWPETFLRQSQSQWFHQRSVKAWSMEFVSFNGTIQLHRRQWQLLPQLLFWRRWVFKSINDHDGFIFTITCTDDWSFQFNVV